MDSEGHPRNGYRQAGVHRDVSILNRGQQHNRTPPARDQADGDAVPAGMSQL